MTTAQRAELEKLILAILQEAREPLTIPKIEEKLSSKGQGPFDTFDVRNAVWQLVDTEQAGFTPRRYVKSG
jgi:hypothetical protein